VVVVLDRGSLRGLTIFFLFLKADNPRTKTRLTSHRAEETQAHREAKAAQEAYGRSDGADGEESG
jgi:hypothetical protein